MGINTRREKEWGKGKILFAWLCIIAFVIVFSVGYGKAMDDLSLEYCSGDYNTPQCKKDRELKRQLAYERKKAESL